MPKQEQKRFQNDAGFQQKRNLSSDSKNYFTAAIKKRVTNRKGPLPSSVSLDAPFPKKGLVKFNTLLRQLQSQDSIDSLQLDSVIESLELYPLMDSLELERVIHSLQLDLVIGSQE